MALGWGALAAAPLLREAGQGRAVSRARALCPRARGAAAAPRHRARVAPHRFLGWRRERHEAVAVEGELSLAADLLGVALGAGLTPYLALRVAARCGPPAVAARLASVLTVADGGEGLAGALELEAGSSPALRPLLDVLLASERLGAPVGPVLARLAADGRARARRAALARARGVPVRLLFPLVFLVLPAFLLLTVAPVVLAGFTR